ncbi:hypothetical protein EBZ39_09195 [bacterium]|nr:hypothetical protein [bacterium]
MKQFSTKLLLALLALSASQVHAVRYTNKTHVTFRPQGENLVIEHALADHLRYSKDTNAWHGKISASAFYQRSENNRGLARLMLFGGKDAVSFKRGVAANPVTPAGSLDLDLGYLVHNNAAAAAPATDETATLKLSPERTTYGMRFDYHHDLGNIFKGLEVHAYAPVVEMRHHLNRIVSGSTNAVQQNADNYFTGKLQATGGNSNQDYLRKAILIDQRAVGIADLELELNYALMCRSWGCIQLGLGATVPTGNTPDGTYAFQPIYGNGHHYAIGAQAGMHAQVHAWREQRLSFQANARYRYLFEGKETRTLGINNRDFGQYLLLGTVGAAANSMLTPAANVLTMPVDVTPGHQFDALAGFSYSWRKLAIDAGYNFFYRQREGVRLREAFTDGVYKIAKRRFDTAAGAGFLAADGEATVNQADLDLNAARDENNLSHSVYASVGLVMNEAATPVVVGVGGSYEFAARNNALEQWTVWAKTGISF